MSLADRLRRLLGTDDEPGESEPSDDESAEDEEDDDADDPSVYPLW